MYDRPLIIIGSARKNGDTHGLVERIFADSISTRIDLLDKYIAPYSYLNDYPENDEFIQVAEQITKHQVIVFATPVYWYAMSGIMKTLFDRFTDLVTIRKEIGRSFQNKKMFLVGVGADREIPDGFEIPFSATAGYLNMTYVEGLYFSVKHPAPQTKFSLQSKEFIKNIEQACTTTE